jgi:hypothetical protein
VPAIVIVHFVTVNNDVGWATLSLLPASILALGQRCLCGFTVRRDAAACCPVCLLLRLPVVTLACSFL